jgi:vacuolar-type H+-ATPase subunit F/Vma7
LKKTFNDFNKNNKEQVIPVFVNIPEPDENNKFSKKQLMNFIIRNLYKQVLLNP